MREFFSRSSETIWGSISPSEEATTIRLLPEPELSTTEFNVFEQAIGDLVQQAAAQLQRGDNEDNVVTHFDMLTEIASNYSLPLTGDDLHAVSRLIRLREANSSLRLVPSLSSIEPAELRKIGVPLELWPAQVRALNEGMLNKAISSFGFAAPTGTGKTALTKVLIADAFATSPSKKVIYVCPPANLRRSEGCAPTGPTWLLPALRQRP